MIKRLLFGVALGAALIACTPASPAATSAPSVAAPTEAAPSGSAPTESMPTESASPAAS